MIKAGGVQSSLRFLRNPGVSRPSVLPPYPSYTHSPMYLDWKVSRNHFLCRTFSSSSPSSSSSSSFFSFWTTQKKTVPWRPLVFGSVFVAPALYSFSSFPRTFPSLLDWNRESDDTTNTPHLVSSVPNGFERFYPDSGKKRASSDPSPSNEPVTDEKSSDEKEKRTEFSQKRSASSPDPSSGNNGSSWSWSFGMGAFLLAVSYLLGSSGKGDGSQISFETFRAEILPSGNVERLEVVNNKIVRVFLRSSRSDPRMSDTRSDSENDFRQSDTVLETNPGESSRYGYDDESIHSDISGLPSRSTVDSLGRLPSSKVVRPPDRSSLQPQFSFTIGSVESFERKIEAELYRRDMSPDSIAITYSNRTNWTSILATFIPTLLLLGFLAYSMRSSIMSSGGGPGGIFSMTKSNAKRFDRLDNVKVTFRDVAGMDEAKQEIMEFVSFLSHPERFQHLGAKIPKGALLLGPPGTGKTLLAKAVAGETKVPFFSISGSDFMEMFVGVGPARVRDLFKTARENRPCIVYIDEIDAIGRPRGRGTLFGGNDERENTLNQLLIELDGFNSLNDVVVLASTNVPISGLDSALLRPGRFDRQIQVDLPEVREREEIFKVHLKPIRISSNALVRDPHSSSADAATTEKTPTSPEILESLARRLAELTPGFAGADIANVCNEGALIAARRASSDVDLRDLESAIDRVVGGIERKTRRLSPEEKRLVAFHEAGHAVVSWYLKYCRPLLKVSIIPRGKAALGYAQYLPAEHSIHTREELVDMICMALGGRAAEHIIFGHWSTGAQDDLQKVTRMAYSQVTQFGFSGSIMRHLAFPGPEQQAMQSQSRGGLGLTRRPYSDTTAREIDVEVRSLIERAYLRTEELLLHRREELRKIAEYLIEHEVMNQKDMETLIGPRSFDPLLSVS